MDSVKITVNSAENASRLELIVRFVWGMLCFIVLWFVGIFAFFAFAIQWLHILFLGKRHPALQIFVNNYEIGMAQVKIYLMLGTDERPPIVPKF